MLDHSCVQCLDLLHLPIGDPVAGELPSDRLQAFANLEKVLHVFLRELRRPGATVRQQQDQTFRSQDLQRFAKRRTRDPEDFAELTLRNARAGENLSIEKHASEASDNFFMQHATWSPTVPCHGLTLLGFKGHAPAWMQMSDFQNKAGRSGLNGHDFAFNLSGVQGVHGGTRRD